MAVDHRRFIGSGALVAVIVLALVLGLLGARAGTGRSRPTTTTTSATTTTTAVVQQAVVPSPPATDPPVGDDEHSVDPQAALGAVPVPVSPTKASTSASCRTDPRANVYHPARLLVVNPCITVSGTVAKVVSESDSDVHIGLAVDPPFKRIVNLSNLTAEGNLLIVEIVPADRPGCVAGQPPRPPIGTYDYGICTGAAVPSPRLGQHVAVTGPYVRDGVHGWMEIHPAWAIVPTSRVADAAGGLGTSS